MGNDLKLSQVTIKTIKLQPLLRIVLLNSIALSSRMTVPEVVLSQYP